MKFLKIEYIIIFILIATSSFGVNYLTKNDKSQLESSYEEAIVYLGMHVNKLLEDGDLITLNRIIKSIRYIDVAIFRINKRLIASNLNEKLSMSEINLMKSNYEKLSRSPIYQNNKLYAHIYIMQPKFINIHWKKYFLIFGFLALVLFTIFLWLKKQRDVQDIKLIADYLSNNEIEKLNINMSSYNSYLYDQLINYREKILQLSTKLKHQAEIETKTMISRQVAHDIRSPLAALNMISKDFNSLPESTRIMLRSSVNRIQDIANNLLTPVSENLNTELKKKSVYLLAPLIEELISEKRTEIRSKQNIIIDTNLTNSYGVFVKINQSQFKRVLSNILNNSIDAKNYDQTNILVSFKKTNKLIQIIITDNGIGIPSHVLPKLFKDGVSFGKENLTTSGSGLGLYHAKNYIKECGGDIRLKSKLSIGTTVTISLPTIDPPEWFIDNILISPKQKIIITDDDSSIHQIWNKRLDQYVNEYKLELIHFSDPNHLAQWLSKNDIDNTLFLIDYEFINNKVNGLDIIEKNQIYKQSILITSRFEEEIVKERCLELGVKLIPKMMSEIAPIKINRPKQYDVIHLDDDELIRLSWQLCAKEKEKNLLSVSNFQMLMKNLKEISKNTPIYIDSSLGENCPKGEEVAKSLFELGYKNLYMSTGYEKERFDNMPWIKGVIGKKAPFFNDSTPVH